MYYSIEKRCLNNREREQKYIEEFRKRVLTIAIKKRNNLRESNRINFFFHGRGGIVYPPFILTFFFCQAQRKRRTKKEQESRQWSISKKKEKEKEKEEKWRATNARLFLSFYRIFELALHCCCRTAHFLPRLSDAALSSRYIAAPAELLHFKSQSCTYKRSYRQGLVVRPTYFIHISYCVSRTNNSPRFGRSLFRSKENSEGGEFQRYLSWPRIYRFSTRTNKLTKRCRKDCASGSKVVPRNR